MSFLTNKGYNDAYDHWQRRSKDYYERERGFDYSHETNLISFENWLADQKNTPDLSYSIGYVQPSPSTPEEFAEAGIEFVSKTIEENFNSNASFFLKLIKALEILGEDAKPSIPLLICMLGSDSEEIRIHVLNLLSKLTGKSYEDFLDDFISILTHNTSTWKGLFALHALARLGQRASKAVPAYIEILHSKTPSSVGIQQIRLEIINALGKLGATAKPAVPILESLLTVKFQFFRIVAHDHFYVEQAELSCRALISITGSKYTVRLEDESKSRLCKPGFIIIGAILGFFVNTLGIRAVPMVGGLDTVANTAKGMAPILGLIVGGLLAWLFTDTSERRVFSATEFGQGVLIGAIAGVIQAILLLVIGHIAMEGIFLTIFYIITVIPAVLSIFAMFSLVFSTIFSGVIWGIGFGFWTFA